LQVSIEHMILYKPFLAFGWIFGLLFYFEFVVFWLYITSYIQTRRHESPVIPNFDTYARYYPILVTVSNAYQLLTQFIMLRFPFELVPMSLWCILSIGNVTFIMIDLVVGIVLAADHSNYWYLIMMCFLGAMQHLYVTSKAIYHVCKIMHERNRADSATQILVNSAAPAVQLSPTNLIPQQLASKQVVFYVVINVEGADQTCPICYNDYEFYDDIDDKNLSADRTLLIKLPCGHEFHENCLDNWIATDAPRTCPTCRRNLPVEPKT
jgi:hypothetical protein